MIARNSWHLEYTIPVRHRNARDTQPKKSTTGVFNKLNSLTSGKNASCSLIPLRCVTSFLKRATAAAAHVSGSLSIPLCHPDQHTSTNTIQNDVKAMMKAFKPLGEESAASINDTKFSDTLVDVPLTDSEPNESKTKTKTKTKTDQPNADSVQNIQDQNHCRADSIKDGQFASTQATSPALLYHECAQASQISYSGPDPTRTIALFGCVHARLSTAYTHAISPIVTLR